MENVDLHSSTSSGTSEGSGAVLSAMALMRTTEDEDRRDTCAAAALFVDKTDAREMQLTEERPAAAMAAMREGCTQKKRLGSKV